MASVPNAARKGAIGIAFAADPRDPGAFSGASLGVIEALERDGWHVVSLRPQLPGILDPVTRRTGPTRLHAWLASVVGSHELRRAGELDGVIQIGTEFELEPDCPLVTYEDMTVRLGKALGWVGVADRPEMVVRDWIARQKRIYERARSCCVWSRWAASSIERDYGIPPEKIRVVGAGCNRRPTAVERDWSTPRFLFAGRDWQRKNAAGVVRAFEEVRRPWPTAQLDLVGEMPPSDTPGIINHGALELEHPEHRTQLERLFELATCFVMPSWVEPLGIVYLEAALAGIPSIGTTVGGAADVIVEGGGLLVDPGDHAALVSAMETLADPSTASPMGATARRHASQYSWDAVSQRLLRGLGLPSDRAAELSFDPGGQDEPAAGNPIAR